MMLVRISAVGNLSSCQTRLENGSPMTQTSLPILDFIWREVFLTILKKCCTIPPKAIVVTLKILHVVCHLECHEPIKLF